MSAPEASGLAITPRLAIGLLVAALLGLGGTVAYQGRMLAEQARQLALLEATAMQLRGQYLRMSFIFTAELARINRTLRDLQRDGSTGPAKPGASAGKGGVGLPDKP